MASTKTKEKPRSPVAGSAQSKDSTTTKQSKKTQKKKVKNPFRIRIGNLVALRSPTCVPDNWIAVWTPFPPTTPLDWTLLGQTIRCTDPRSQCHLEGLVVRVIDTTTVELLIQRQRTQNGSEKLKVVEYEYASSRDQVLQQRIQGSGTLVVVVEALRKFVVRRYVPPKHWEDAAQLGERTSSSKTFNTGRVLHVGDSNDSTQQQVENWRWLAARCSARSWPEIGQVLSVDPSPSESSTSVAKVTLRRCLWPEQTRNGRQPFHGLQSVYIDADATTTLEVPIEQVVQIARKVTEASDVVDPMCVAARCKYSFNRNIYFSLQMDALDTSKPHCHRCRHQVGAAAATLTPCPECGRNWWCPTCWEMRCCTTGTTSCDCTLCQAVAKADLEGEWDDCLALHHEEGDSMAVTLEKIPTRVPFGLPPGFLGPAWPLPQTQPCTKLVFPKRNGRRKPAISDTGKRKRQRSPTPDRKPEIAKPEDYSIFRPTCARATPYDRKNSFGSRGTQEQQQQPTYPPERPRNIRDLQVSRLLTAPPSASQPSHRAVRANQRRNRQTVGPASFLSARSEPQLRFSRSRIHRWGVFADQSIVSDDLIIEYRGELIGNSLAERRHEVYTRELGSDYMFRIDAHQVCDATKLGNVARFINASCDPNCYTKIISAEGSKRIVIYAKRDIAVGEELSYDYKFELEPDPANRIPCHCGAKDCRGFMNWNKKFASQTVSPDSAASGPSSFGKKHASAQSTNL